MGNSESSFPKTIDTSRKGYRSRSFNHQDEDQDIYQLVKQTKQRRKQSKHDDVLEKFIVQQSAKLEEEKMTELVIEEEAYREEPPLKSFVMRTDTNSSRRSNSSRSSKSGLSSRLYQRQLSNA